MSGKLLIELLGPDGVTVEPFPRNDGENKAKKNSNSIISSTAHNVEREYRSTCVLGVGEIPQLTCTC